MGITTFSIVRTSAKLAVVEQKGAVGDRPIPGDGARNVGKDDAKTADAKPGH